MSCEPRWSASVVEAAGRMLGRRCSCRHRWTRLLGEQSSSSCGASRGGRPSSSSSSSRGRAAMHKTAAGEWMLGKPACSCWLRAPNARLQQAVLSLIKGWLVQHGI